MFKVYIKIYITHSLLPEKSDSWAKHDSAPKRVIMTFMKSYFKKDGNIITYNLLRSNKLTMKLKAKSTSLVRTIKRIRREIPNTIESVKTSFYDNLHLILKNTRDILR